MFKFVCFILTFLFTVSTLDVTQSLAQSRFQQIQQGVNKSTASGGESKEEKDYIDKEKQLKEKGIDTRYSGSDGTRRKNVATLHDPILIGVFETYLVKKRHNARLTVFGEARKFALGHRACTKIKRIRDKINAYLYKNPPETDKRGRVQTEGMDAGIRQAIKEALKTKLEYYSSILVVNGRWGPHKVPKELEGETVSDCKAVFNKKKEMDKAAKG